jgi:hypothetical protein
MRDWRSELASLLAGPLLARLTPSFDLVAVRASRRVKPRIAQGQ